MIAPRIAIPGSTVVRGIGCQGRRAADADQVAYNAGSRLALPGPHPVRYCRAGTDDVSHRPDGLPLVLI